MSGAGLGRVKSRYAGFDRNLSCELGLTNLLGEFEPMRGLPRKHARPLGRHPAPTFRAFTNDADDPGRESAPLSIPELEIGLRILGGAEPKQKTFWDVNIVRFRQTILLAIRDTSDALLEQTITPPWRIELESQLEELVEYLELANRYLAKRSRIVSQPTIS